MPASGITVPNTFVPDTTIESAEVNTNFSTVYTRANKLRRVINSQFADSGTPASTTETTLYTFTLDAGLLGTNGDVFFFDVSFFTDATNTTKVIRVNFGGTNLAVITFDTAAETQSTTGRISGYILRRDATNGVQVFSVFSGGSASDVVSTTANLQFMRTEVKAFTFANALVFNITGQNGTAVANQIVARGMVLEYAGL
jgi:hypothetical protein